MPPTQMPFFFDAAILSRIRSPVTSALRKGEKDVQGQPSHARGRIEALGHADEGAALLLEELDEPCEPPFRTQNLPSAFCSAHNLTKPGEDS
jgi:hypothetical protein